MDPLIAENLQAQETAQQPVDLEARRPALCHSAERDLRVNSYHETRRPGGNPDESTEEGPQGADLLEIDVR